MAGQILSFKSRKIRSRNCSAARLLTHYMQETQQGKSEIHGNNARYPLSIDYLLDEVTGNTNMTHNAYKMMQIDTGKPHYGHIDVPCAGGTKLTNTSCSTTLTELPQIPLSKDSDEG